MCFCTQADITSLHNVKLIHLINVQSVFYLLANDIYHSNGISKMNNDFENTFLISNFVLSIWNFIDLFSYNNSYK